MTIEETKALIQKTLNEYFKETTVVVKLASFSITVLGEVSSQGQYEVNRDDINILQAIGMAGGITNLGNKQKVTLIRQTEKGSEVKYIDLTDKSVLSSEFFFLVPNDMIYVETLAGSYIYGKENTSFYLTILTTITTIATMTYLIAK